MTIDQAESLVAEVGDFGYRGHRLLAMLLLKEVIAERERCAKVAETEGPCCYHQGCHEAIADLIREVPT